MDIFSVERMWAKKKWLSRYSALSLALFAILMTLVPMIHAQTTAVISGTVYDKSGGVLPGANVTLTNGATGEVRSSVTNNDGFFAFPAILSGTYEVKVEAKGFKTLNQQGIAINAGDQRKLSDLTLDIGKTEEVVNVQENLQIIPTDSGQRAAVLDAKDIQELALTSRNLSELLKILPGVTSAPNGVNAGASFNAVVVSNAQSAVGNGLNANGAPNRGGTSQLSDGVDIDDPGCDCNSIAVLNPDFTQEVSVQTSNFGADAPRGPVVINTVSKSGTDKLHGTAYFYARSDVLNANDWQTNHNPATAHQRDGSHYYYPGGNIGGPLPFTHDKILLWFGYERFIQNTGSSNILQSIIPTADMLAGNFNNTPANVTFCQGPLTPKATNGCNDLTGTVLPDGTTVTNHQIPTQYLDPGAAVLASFWPKANADPAKNNGFNYVQAIPGIHDGFVYRVRGDYNLNENNKFFISYQFGQDAALSQGNGAHIYWTPGNSIPYPGGGLFSSTYTRAVSGHFVHIFNPSLTNEFIASWGYGNFPVGPSKASAAYRSTLGYPSNYGTVFNAGSPLIPSYSSGGYQTFPDFSQQDIFETGGKYLVRKEMPAFADNVTKIFGTHTLKFGVFAENVGNIQGASESPNGQLNSFSFGGTLHPNAVTGQVYGSPNNPTANFIQGIVTSYAENNSSPISDMAYQQLAFYGNDQWKATKRISIEYGVRFDHIGHWYDRQGTGMAVWIPSLVASDQASGKAQPGLYWHGINPGIPKSGMPDRLAFVSPRFGIAYDVFGTGKTILRGGWGEYRFAEQYNNYNAALTTAQGIKSYGLPNNTFVQLSQFGDLPKPAPGGISGSVNALDGTSYAIPQTRSYNFTISQQLPFNSLFEIAYVGSDTKNISMGGETTSGGGFADFTNKNKVALGAFFKPDPKTGVLSPNPESITATPGNATADYRPFGFAYGDNSIDVNTSDGYTNYNGLQASWVKRGTHLTYNFNYTWSKTLSTSLNIDPFTVRGNYGVASIDRPQVFNSSYTYNALNAYHGGSHLLAGAINNWTISGITTIQSGGNLQAINNPNFGLSLQYTTINGSPIQNDPTMANYNPLPANVGNSIGVPTYYGTNASISIQETESCNPASNLGASNHRVNGSCFTVPAIGQYGLRNFQYLHGPAYFDSDLALYKTFHITEKHLVQFRASAFNWLNHPLSQFSGGNNLTLKYGCDYTSKACTQLVGPSETLPTFGFFDNKSGGNSQRIVELALKYSF